MSRYTPRMLNVARIGELRSALNLTQQEAADAAGFNSKQHWQNLESGRAGSAAGITLGTLNAIAKALKCDPKELLK